MTYLTHNLWKFDRKYLNVYYHMMHRCYDKKDIMYSNYGGRGIEVCELWKDNIPIFIEYIKNLKNYDKKNYQLDRIDNDGNYEPGNVRWSCRIAQSINRRKKSTNTSGYTGVSEVKSRTITERIKYKSYISIDKKLKHLGYFFSIEDAVSARNKYIIDNNLQSLGFKIQPLN